MSIRSFLDRLDAAIDELEQDRSDQVKYGVTDAAYRVAVGYFEALRDVRAEIQAVVKKLVE